MAKEKEVINEPYELKDEDVDVLVDPDPEDEALNGAEESFEESKERPNEK